MSDVAVFEVPVNSADEVVSAEVSAESSGAAENPAPAPKKRGRPKGSTNSTPKAPKEPKPPREKKDPATRHSKAVAGALTPGEYDSVQAYVQAVTSLNTVSELVRLAVLDFVQRNPAPAAAEAA